jgi:DNA invertase Pin-like site-specific DNA recombinase
MEVSMLVGYGRVSTDEQNLDLQLDALKSAGCGRVFQDQCSGSIDNRAGLSELLKFVREGDVLVVWKLDRLGRSLKHLIRTVDELQGRGVGFKSLQETIDTTTSGGKLIFHVFAALAEFERDLIKERTKAGLVSARARGRIGGRPKAMDQTKVRLAQAMMKDPHASVEAICQTLQVSKSTLYRYSKLFNALHTNK